jgi:predicted nucleotide-binding protein (sugar kinase/HSP70/actin superfamily)
LAKKLNRETNWEKAYEHGYRAQQTFEKDCRNIGIRALEFADQHHLKQIIVLGRSYTIHNNILNSNVPNLLREQGALAIPLDCYPLNKTTPIFPGIYWGSSQTCLRAAHQIRQSPGQYAVYCSNYSCGPDSFTLHFFSYIMEGKPFTIIETDGHSGDAGTKTRVEAFLYCVDTDMKNPTTALLRPANDFAGKDTDTATIEDLYNSGETLLIPRMGPCAETIAALLSADGRSAQALPPATRDSLRLARKYTSGKECLPLTITLGSLLSKLEQEKKTDKKFAFLMPKANGPCRFGMYNIFQKIILEQTPWADRIQLISPSDEDYFSQVPPDFQLRAFACFVATDMLQAALHDVRPVEKSVGLAQSIYDRFIDEQKKMMMTTGSKSLVSAFGSIFSNVFGLHGLLRRAGQEFARAKNFSRILPRVAVVGEIYVRLDPFANDNLVEKLEKRGLACLLAPFNEWLLYTTLNELQRFDEDRTVPGDKKSGALMNRAVQNQIVRRLHNAMGKPLAWGARTRVEQIIHAAKPYLNPELISEAILSLGGPVHEFEHGMIDGVIAVGPHECMPNKIVESQFFHVGEKTGLPTLVLSVNGEPIDPEILDRFAFEVYEQHAKNN